MKERERAKVVDSVRLSERMLLEENERKATREGKRGREGGRERGRGREGGREREWEKEGG